MTAVPFDTLKFSRKLRDAGVPPEQADGMVEAMADTMTSAELVTTPLLKSELERFEVRMTVRFGVMLATAFGLLIALDRHFLVPA